MHSATVVTITRQHCVQRKQNDIAQAADTGEVSHETFWHFNRTFDLILVDQLSSQLMDICAELFGLECGYEFAHN
ncbi:hypothetical protein D3C80_1299980 [compost metagenome]